MNRFARKRVVQILLAAMTATAIVDVAAAETPVDGDAHAHIDSFTLRDAGGKQVSLPAPESSPVVVVAFMGTECPLVIRYVSRLNAMAKEFGPQGVTFLGVDSNQQDSLAEMAHFVRTQAIAFPLLKDPGNVVADQFDAKRTPEVFVLDQNRRIQYRGKIDDQFTYERQRPEPKHRYLRAAIEAVLAGKAPQPSRTEVDGCHIGRKLEPNPDAKITFSNQISRIFAKRCIECHREGEIGPFALTDYDEVVGWAGMIAEVVDNRRMPPWHANPQHGAFSNNARLSDTEVEQILQWVRDGAPEGDPSQLPEPPTFTEGWRIGEPDDVFYMDKPFTVPAEAPVEGVRYQYFVVDPKFTEDKWIRAAECRPGQRAVVHHIIVGIQPPGARRRGVHGGSNSAWLAATAPGARPMDLPPHQAKFVPAGSKLVFQMHYTPNGTEVVDRSCVGFIYADPDKVTHKVLTQQVVNENFAIEPGAESHPVTRTSRPLPIPLEVTAFFPHMHLRGKSFRYTALIPGHDPEILLDVPNYDFNWQNAYILKTPRTLPRGTRIRCDATFDNSEDNLANPDPTATVRWGDQTWEEMMIGYFDVIVPVRKN